MKDGDRHAPYCRKYHCGSYCWKAFGMGFAAGRAWWGRLLHGDAPACPMCPKPLAVLFCFYQELRRPIRHYPGGRLYRPDHWRCSRSAMVKGREITTVASDDVLHAPVDLPSPGWRRRVRCCAKTWIPKGRALRIVTKLRHAFGKPPLDVTANPGRCARHRPELFPPRCAGCAHS